MTNNRTDFPGEIATVAARWAERFVQGMSDSEKAEFKTWLTGQRELLGKLIVAAGIKLQ